MAKKADAGGISSDTPMPLDQSRCPLPNRVQEFVLAIMTVQISAQCRAGLGVSMGGRSNGEAGRGEVQRRALDNGQGLPHGKAEFGVQGQRSIVVCCLNEAHARETLLLSAREYRLHELLSYTSILDVRVDGDGTDTSNEIRLPKEV